MLCGFALVFFVFDNNKLLKFLIDNSVYQLLKQKFNEPSTFTSSFKYNLSDSKTDLYVVVIEIKINI